MPDISIAIPTYQREGVLLDTLEQLLALQYPAKEILVVDQTPRHLAETMATLEKLQSNGHIVWHRLSKPSIPKAMNHALMAAKCDFVLFLDDDIRVTSELVREHAAAHDAGNVACVAGRVVQQWERELGEWESAWHDGRVEDPDAFRFNSASRRLVERFAGGNFSIERNAALEVGGFDENFVAVAYRYEAEFADRLLARGYQILFEPAASVFHLKADSGGTRSFGHHLRSLKPAHSVGRYYYLITTKRLTNRFSRFVQGPISAVRTRHHLSRPWWIPVTLIAELSGMVWAWWLSIRGPKYVGMRNPK
ncbi:MAG: glycosyltransferase [Gammaproteobacteria bacterium]|nr:glycosyltransferase [Gammaproteobacteria bacterium]NIM71845.1 glycosyltransferase [Gammaproteobacteria bacterium]NIN37967.1 glycosyltransferase [Gammaproteobacteria bacterium]NIO23601.1 glycosyltransferase [Gammaproteobacteria bacterium]NIO64217.1 glycosyltransferase [Gammaproteobacteria bacterium]